MQAPTHKLIIINDLNKELSPIGYGFKSPIYKPYRFSIETIGQLLNVSKVTAMYEVYEKDETMRVHLDKNNYRKPFEEIWREQNPGKEFPWANEVETVGESSPAQEEIVDEQPPVETVTDDEGQPVEQEQNTEPVESLNHEDLGFGSQGLVQETSPEQAEQNDEQQQPAPQLSSGTFVAPVDESKNSSKSTPKQQKKQRKK